MRLTPSLPSRRLKTTNNSAKFEILKPSCLLFSHWRLKGFSSVHIVLKITVTGPENLLFAGASVRLTALKFYRLWQWMGLEEVMPLRTSFSQKVTRDQKQNKTNNSNNNNDNKRSKSRTCFKLPLVSETVFKFSFVFVPDNAQWQASQLTCVARTASWNVVCSYNQRNKITRS